MPFALVWISIDENCKSLLINALFLFILLSSECLQFIVLFGSSISCDKSFILI